MTFRAVIDQLKITVETAKETLMEAKNTFNDYSASSYFHMMAQVFAKRSLEKSEDDLQFFLNFLNDYPINVDDETGGVEYLILHLERNKY